MRGQRRPLMADARQNNRDFTLLFLVMLITGAGNTALQSVLPTLGRTIGVPDSVIAAAFLSRASRDAGLRLASFCRCGAPAVRARVGPRS